MRMPPLTDFAAACSVEISAAPCEQCGTQTDVYTSVTINGKALCLCCARGETPPRNQYAHPQCKLTDEDAYQIRQRHAKGADAQRLANLFKVHISSIYRVLRGGAH